MFQTTLHSTVKIKVLASVRNSHRTAQIAAENTCWFAISHEQDNSFRLNLTSCKHRHRYYIGIIHIFEELQILLIFGKRNWPPDVASISTSISTNPLICFVHATCNNAINVSINISTRKTELKTLAKMEFLLVCD